jgi:hypothetical protein
MPGAVAQGLNDVINHCRQLFRFRFQRHESRHVGPNGHFQSRDADFDIFDFDGLGRVIEDGLGISHSDGRGRGRIDHRLQQCSGCRRGSLLQPRDGLPERSTAGLPIGFLKLGHLQPAQERVGADAGCLAASSVFRWVRSAAIASSFLRPNFVPCPAICTLQHASGVPNHEKHLTSFHRDLSNPGQIVSLHTEVHQERGHRGFGKPAIAPGTERDGAAAAATEGAQGSVNCASFSERQAWKPPSARAIPLGMLFFQPRDVVLEPR